jgi:hypothetical protein
MTTWKLIQAFDTRKVGAKITDIISLGLVLGLLWQIAGAIGVFSQHPAGSWLKRIFWLKRISQEACNVSHNWFCLKVG